MLVKLELNLRLFYLKKFEFKYSKRNIQSWDGGKNSKQFYKVLQLLVGVEYIIGEDDR